MVSKYFLPYKSGDIYEIVEEQYKSIIVEDKIVKDFTWSLYTEVGLVACGGIAQMWAGVYELWFNPPNIIKQYPIAILKKAKEIVDALMKIEGVYRIQAQLQYNLEGRDHLMRFLGFHYEGRLCKFINNEDYAIYAYVRRNESWQ